MNVIALYLNKIIYAQCTNRYISFNIIELWEDKNKLSCSFLIIEVGETLLCFEHHWKPSSTKHISETITFNTIFLFKLALIM